jgi:hypothetical protein
LALETKALNALKNIQPLTTMLREQKAVAAIVEATKKTSVETQKLSQPVKQILKKAGEEVTLLEGVGRRSVLSKIHWTNHGYKHFPPKNMPWKNIIKVTKNGDAKYKPGINIEYFERMAWKNGIPVTNGKSWKVFKSKDVIGAKNVIETTCVRIEISAKTIHGHPITTVEYTQLIK